MDLDIGDTIDVPNDHEIVDWGEMIDGRYTYALLGEDTEYYIAVSEYEVLEKRDYESEDI
jgi:hypothetical protein